jgi:hypothetical protein
VSPQLPDNAPQRSPDGLAALRVPAAWTFIVLAVLLIKTRGSLDLGFVGLPIAVAIVTAAAVAVPVRLAHRRAEDQRVPLLWASAAVAVFVLPFVAWLQIADDANLWGIGIGAWTVQLWGAAVLAWCLSLERIANSSELTLPTTLGFVGAFALVEATIAFAAFWWIVPWTLNAVGGSGGSGWLIQSAVVFVAAGALLMLTGSRTRWPIMPAKWANRDIVTIAISSLALTVSVLAVIYPVANQAIRARLAAQDYLVNVTTSSSFYANAAKWLAEPGSPAQEFAERIEHIWMASRSLEVATSNGTADSNGSFTSRFRVCFPPIATIPVECATADNFLFSESGRITDFTLNSIPVRALFEANDLSEREAIEVYPDDPGNLELVQISNLAAPGGVQTAVFQIWGDDATSSDLTSVELVNAQDGATLAWAPLELERSNIRYYWALKMPRSTAEVNLCFTRDDGTESCRTYNVWG